VEGEGVFIELKLVSYKQEQVKLWAVRGSA